MAGIKNSFSKGLTTINVKASNFMEENKLKTHISTLETEIEKLKFSVAEEVYKEYVDGTFAIENVSEMLDTIKEKYHLIDQINAEINNLSTKEMEILGSTANQNAVQEGVQFCSQCGAPYKVGYKFCEKCGNKLD